MNVKRQLISVPQLAGGLPCLPWRALAVLAAVTALMFGMPGGGVGTVQAATTTITATVVGSPTPPVGPCPVANGGFTIASAFAPCGDGVDEVTTWKFDFTNAICGPLTSAVLTLTLQPKDSQFTNDQVYVGGPGGPGTLSPTISVLDSDWAPASPYNNVPPQLNQFTTMSIDLINGGPAYGSAAILGVFNDPSHPGQIPMAYQDDAIISFASLALTGTACVPVGGTTDFLGDASGPATASTTSGSSGGGYVMSASIAAMVGLISLGGAALYLRRRRSQ